MKRAKNVSLFRIGLLLIYQFIILLISPFINLENLINSWTILMLLSMWYYIKSSDDSEDRFPDFPKLYRYFTCPEGRWKEKYNSID